jgi:hypothetical protein
VISTPPPFECLEPIGRRNPQITELCGIVKIKKLSSRGAQYIGWKRSRSLGATIEKQIFCQPVTESLYHMPTLSKSDN